MPDVVFNFRGGVATDLDSELANMGAESRGDRLRCHDCRCLLLGADTLSLAHGSSVVWFGVSCPRGLVAHSPSISADANRPPRRGAIRVHCLGLEEPPSVEELRTTTFAELRSVPVRDKCFKVRSLRRVVATRRPIVHWRREHSCEWRLADDSDAFQDRRPSPPCELRCYSVRALD